MTAPDIAAIARSLTSAQKEAILWMHGDGTPREHDKKAPREASFYALRNVMKGDPTREIARTCSLCLRGDGEKRPGQIWPAATWRLTPLGLTLRQYLKDNPDV